jgi:hypothetical protein
MEGVRITAGKNKTTRVRFTLPEPDSNEPVILTDLSSEWRTELRQRFVAESTRRRGGEKVVLTCDPAAPLPAASIPLGLQMPTADQLNVVWKAAEDGGVACHYQAPDVARQHIESKPAPPATAPAQVKVETVADDVSVPAKATQKSNESKDAAPVEDRTAPSATAETSSIPGNATNPQPAPVTPVPETKPETTQARSKEEPPADSRATSSQPAATVAMGAPPAAQPDAATHDTAPEAKRDEHPKPREESAPSATSRNATSAGQPAVAVTKTEPAPAPAAAEPAAVQPQTEQGLQPQPEPRAEPIPPAAQQHGRAETSVTGASTSTLLVTVAGGDAFESQPSLVIAAAKAPAFHDDRVVLQSSVRGLLARRLEPPLLVSFVSGKRLPMIHFAESLQKEERAFRAAHPTLDHDSRWMRFDDTPPRVSTDSAAMNREAAKYNTEATKVFNARQRAMPRNVRFGSVS